MEDNGASYGTREWNDYKGVWVFGNVILIFVKLVIHLTNMSIP
jgi:hypothetical protein